MRWLLCHPLGGGGGVGGLEVGTHLRPHLCLGIRTLEAGHCKKLLSAGEDSVSTGQERHSRTFAGPEDCRVTSGDTALAALQ